jgi:aspartyl-tRNA(Asn)/glutamyl-tRNA(Gln) amidotransferase subunit B
VGCTVQPRFSFDRKHYFYGDQPAGYQITQHYEPYAKDGLLELFERDGVQKAVLVRIKQIQIEQDTGKSTYVESGANIDLNRTNTGLIELVTEPDIPSPEAAGIFVRKLQTLLRHLGVCSGELETGAMRVDVNVSVNGGKRCEIKNLFSTSAVVHAIKAEFARQKRELQTGGIIEMETRGWDGKNTWKLRGKEDTVDYRYMPDPELMPVVVSPDIIAQVRQQLPKLPDEIFQELLSPPYSVPVVNARTLMSVPYMVDYYRQVYDSFLAKGGKSAQSISNWIVHRLWGELNMIDKPFSPDILPATVLSDLILRVEHNKITSTSATLILKHLIANKNANESIDDLIIAFSLGKVEEGSQDVQQALVSLCEKVIADNAEVVLRVKSGKPKSIKFLVGQVMRECQGRVNATTAEELLRKLIK